LIAKSDSWTRFNSSGNNSNIDIIVYSQKLKNIIQTEFLQHIPELSDHKGILVTIKNIWNTDLKYKKKIMINKGWMYK